MSKTVTITGDDLIRLLSLALIGASQRKNKGINIDTENDCLCRCAELMLNFLRQERE